MSSPSKANEQWIPLQIKVFTRWFNSQLKELNQGEINNIVEDLKTGVFLVEVIQFLSKKNAPRSWKKNPVSNFDMVQNCDLAIEMLQNEGISIVGISGKDVNDKNEKLILGLVWSLILHFSIDKSIQNSSNKPSKNALLVWAIERTCHYSNVTEFEPYHLSICALLDSFYPEKINFKNLNPNEIAQNIQLATTVMEDLEIPIYIYPEDVIKNDGKVDEKTLLTQLAVAKPILENPRPKKQNVNISPQIDQKPLTKKSFTPEDPSGEDILSYGEKLDRKYNYFACKGEMGTSIMKGDPNNNWKSTENSRGITEFKIGFTRYSINLKTFALHTGNDNPPNQFFLFGYDSHMDQWNLIFVHKNVSLKPNSLYRFNISEDKQKNPYRAFCFLSCTGSFTLAYIKLYGDIVEESDSVYKELLENQNLVVRKNLNFSCLIKNGQFSDGVFRTAMNEYGPELSYFLTITYNCSLSKNVKLMDIWNARNLEFKTNQIDGPVFLSIYLLHNEIAMTGYQISAPQNSTASWAVIGCKDSDDDGVVLDEQQDFVFENENLLTIQFDDDEESVKSFRIIRFVGLNGLISFKCFDILGNVVVADEMTNDEVTKGFGYPSEIDDLIS